MHLLIALILAAIPYGVAAHTMNPSSQKIFVTNDTMYVKYEVTNKFPWPAVFVMEVLEKDQETVFTKWDVSQDEIKLFENNSQDVYIKVDATQERKIIVCSKLYKVGYDEKPARVITRVCSKLWLYR